MQQSCPGGQEPCHVSHRHSEVMQPWTCSSPVISSPTTFPIYWWLLSLIMDKPSSRSVILALSSCISTQVFLTCWVLWWLHHICSNPFKTSSFQWATHVDENSCSYQTLPHHLGWQRSYRCDYTPYQENRIQILNREKKDMRKKGSSVYVLDRMQSLSARFLQ